MNKTEKIALIIYGDGGELGNFKIFADNLKQQLSKTYSDIPLHYINRDFDFFKLIESIAGSKKEISELHIFAHSIGAGLFLGYKDRTISSARNTLVRTKTLMGSKVNYDEVVKTEIGAIQTDDFKLSGLVGKQALLRQAFGKDAIIKIWGCNSGVNGWVYSDGGVVDPGDTSEAYYWRAFNEKHTPKPSIAQAFAGYFNVKVFGAGSGASIQVKFKNKWISSKTYHQKVGHWPSGTLPHRLVPDRGDYNEYLP